MNFSEDFKSKNESRPSILNYTDYRKFLCDFYEFKKSTESRYSFRYFSVEANIKSTNYLKLVIDGERNLSRNLLKGFAKACRMDKKERPYFYALVEFNQEKKLNRKNRLLKKAMKILTTSTQKEVHNEQFELLSKWYYIVIRTLLGMNNIPGDPKIIAKYLSGLISPRDSAMALEELKRMGFIGEKDGVLKPLDKHVKMEDEILNTAIQNYHSQIIPIGVKHLKLAPLNEREFQAATISLPKENIPEIKMKIKSFYNDLISYISNLKNESTELCQFNFQFFKYQFKGGK